jgi:hypothetical protein
MGVAFFPRGGSAQVVRGLAGALPRHGWDVTIVAGSYGEAGDAHRFYAGLDVRAHEQAPALMGSYEDRPGAPDRVFAALDDETYERQVEAWARVLRDAGAADADVLHLHHLTPLHEAAARVAPDVPVVGHLHGTELLMLERIADGAPPSRSGRASSGCSGSRPTAASRSRTGSTSTASTARRSTAPRPGGARSSRRRAAGVRAARPARSPTRRPTSRRCSATCRCCSTSAATPRSSGSRC